MSAIIQIGDIKIIEDQYGRYRLNDLHKAAGGEKRHQPSDWLRLSNTQELIENIRKEICAKIEPEIFGSFSLEPVVTIKGGDFQGTFATKKLVYAYATWISPTFFSHVLDVFEEQRNKQIEEIKRRENMTEIEILRENAKLTLRLADEMEAKQKLTDKISSGALFEKLNLIQDVRPVISLEDIKENYFLGFSTLAIDQFLRYTNHPKREVVVAGKFPKNMYIDENMFEAAHQLWNECEKVKTKKFIELSHKCFLDRKAFMLPWVAKQVWGF